MIVLVLGAALATVSIVATGLSGPVGRWVFRAAVLAIWGAVAVLIAALVRVDTSLVLVVDHTRPGLHVVRRVMGLWGGSAGSLLFFCAVVGAIVASVPARQSHRWAALGGPIVVSALAWASVLLDSPFETLSVPAIAGSGLSPILEHWAMMIHPPLLYGGLALALGPAAIATPVVAARWASAAFVVLTASLTLGGAWAYVELGWGGWWAWDPVENAGLIVWLLLLVGVHLGPHAPGHPVLRWASLAIWPAVFSGVAMTRTSLRTSVHAFADAEGLAWVLWPLAAAVALGALAIGAVDAAPAARRHGPDSRVVWLAVGVAMLSALVVAVGTFRPFVPGDSTDGSYYTRLLFPVAVMGLVALGVGPRWRFGQHRQLVTQALLGAAAGAALGLFAGWTQWFQLVFATALGAAVVTVLGELQATMSSFARTLGHLGIVLVLAGALGGTASQTRTVELSVGESVVVAGYAIENEGAALVGDDPPVIEAQITVDGRHVLRPALTVYAERALRLPEVATHSRPWEDLQVILRSADDTGAAVVTANVQPLTQLVWVGAALIAMSGIAANQRSRLRRWRNSSLMVADDAGSAGAVSAVGAGSGAAATG